MSTSFAKLRSFQSVFSPVMLSLTSATMVTFCSAIAPIGVSAQQSQPMPSPSSSSGSAATEAPRPNSLESSVFSITGGQRLMSESMTAVSQQNYDQAVSKLQDARQVFNQLSSFYQELNTSFTGIDNRLADGHRRKALQTAQLRDEATYQLAVVYRAKNQPELAVPLLIQLIRSQAPTRDLGKQAYQQLYEIGFVDAEYVPPRAATPSAR